MNFLPYENSLYYRLFCGDRNWNICAFFHTLSCDWPTAIDDTLHLFCAAGLGENSGRGHTVYGVSFSSLQTACKFSQANGKDV
jgi:hypothetical protein